ncbi:carboxymuconolactone decarboxylase family protein [Actinomadura fulvescens]|uniref:Carboxymuconolactone decarboxylase family protein n=1 Tax=Actinomadura fulvescens TaxID=46160 RepID=A0ABP6C164_9ACTN
MTSLFVRAARRGAQEQIGHVSLVRHEAARGRVAEIYAQLERDFGILAPPVILHSPAPAMLAAAWMMLRETLVATGRADRAAKEAVAAAVSLGNSCPYCVEVHSMTLHGLVRGHDAEAIARDRLIEIREPRIAAIAEWARRSGEKGPSGRDTPPFLPALGPELIGVAVVFHYYNRMVNVFLGDTPFPDRTPARVRRGLKRLIGRYMAPGASNFHEPGASLGLLPGGPLPEDFGWAKANGMVADAFARSATAIDEAGKRVVPASVRDLLAAELEAWDGRPPGLGRGRFDDAVAGLPAADRPAGRLAMLTAMASYRVDQAVIDAFRRDDPADARFVEFVSWAAFTAARRAGALSRDLAGGIAEGAEGVE